MGFPPFSGTINMVRLILPSGNLLLFAIEHGPGEIVSFSHFHSMVDLSIVFC